MSTAYDNLDPGFHDKLLLLEAACLDDGVTVRAYYGLRDPVEQGRLWRQSRSSADVEAAIDKLEQQGAPFLADCLAAAKSTTGPWATNALPGQSWHQFGEGMDYTWIVNGEVDWTVNLTDPKNGYATLIRNAPIVGLVSGVSFKDYGHVQKRTGGSPMAYGMTMIEIDAAMKAKFPDLLKGV
jgi:peptidoglycan LD-endopeptidase CwlK